MVNDANQRVLIVDDDEDVRNILNSVLERRGLTVHSAGTANAALTLVAENNYAVIVLDLLLPGADGFEVLDWLKSGDAPHPGPVVLVLTGAPNEVVERVDPQRIHGLVRKPFDPEDLASLVFACAEIKRRGPFPTMAIATMLSGAQLMAWLNHLGR